MQARSVTYISSLAEVLRLILPLSDITSGPNKHRSHILQRHR